jgi:acyl-CoA synthetase (AMP-forming)/AMP-acid ligase II
MEVLTPLTMGACVCVPQDEERLRDLGQAMATLRATWSFLTPSVANLLDPDAVSATLRTLVCGGEAMHPETIARWADRVELINGYGPTEACVLSVVNPLVSIERDSSVIGFGTPSTRTWILDTGDGNKGNRLAPVGAAGELALSGPILARGYLNDPEKTARAFLENPAWASSLPAAISPSRIYRTGDLVRYRSDGAIEFIGRRDGQVKINGQRMELGEIENRLVADRNVRLALVIQPKAGPCKKQLVGILNLANLGSGSEATEAAGAGGISMVNGSGGDCKPVEGPPERLTRVRAQVAEVRARLTDMLPHYMVPAVWIALESLPIGVSGKLDRVRVARWVEALDDATYDGIKSSLGLVEEGGEEVELTGHAKTLMEICSKELRMPMERMKPNQSFVSLGKNLTFPLTIRNGLANLSLRSTQVAIVSLPWVSFRVHETPRSSSLSRMCFGPNLSSISPSLRNWLLRRRQAKCRALWRPRSHSDSLQSRPCI